MGSTPTATRLLATRLDELERLVRDQKSEIEELRSSSRHAARSALPTLPEAKAWSSQDLTTRRNLLKLGGAVVGAAGLAGLGGLKQPLRADAAYALQGDVNNNASAPTTLGALSTFSGSSILTGAANGVGNAIGVRGLGSGNAAGVSGSGGGNNGIGVYGAGGFPDGTGIWGHALGAGPGVVGEGGYTSGAGVQGTGGTPNGKGVNGFGTGTGTGVSGLGGGTDAAGVAGVGGTTNGNGVEGYGTGAGVGLSGKGGGSNAAGVRGTGGSTNGTGVVGQGTGAGIGVYGLGGPTDGTGIRGDGYGQAPGVKGIGGLFGPGGNGAVGGWFDAGPDDAPLHLQQKSTTGIPATGTHAVGDFWIDAYGTLYWCISPGSPGIWAQVASGRGEVGGVPLHLGPAAAAGPPSSGARLTGDIWVDSNGIIWACVTGGSPGTWVSLQPGQGPTAASNNLYKAVITNQPTLQGSNGSTWVDIDGTNLTLTITPAYNCLAVVTGNADLWTDTAGFNQDIGVFINGGAYSNQIVAWKESGGFAGTFSPNAAYVQTVQPLVKGTAYTIKLQWKTNKNAPGVTIVAGAGPIAGNFSPTSLTALLSVTA